MLYTNKNLILEHYNLIREENITLKNIKNLLIEENINYQIKDNLIIIEEGFLSSIKERVGKLGGEPKKFDDSRRNFAKLAAGTIALGATNKGLRSGVANIASSIINRKSEAEISSIAKAGALLHPSILTKSNTINNIVKNEAIKGASFISKLPSKIKNPMGDDGSKLNDPARRKFIKSSPVMAAGIAKGAVDIKDIIKNTSTPDTIRFATQEFKRQGVDKLNENMQNSLNQFGQDRRSILTGKGQNVIKQDELQNFNKLTQYI